MQIISSEMLTDMRELPLVASAVLFVLGLCLYLTGSMTYRFWVVLATTFGAGLYGLSVGSDYGVQPIVAGLLLAVAAGCLALALARVAIFGWYGLVCWYAVQRFAPQFAVPVVCIIAGGLFTVLFYRICVMMMTSAAGMICLAYAGLDLADRVGGLSSIHWVADNSAAVQFGYLASILVGAVLQQRVEQSHKKYKAYRSDYAEWQQKKKSSSGGNASPAALRKLLAWLPRMKKAG
jgi:hypothetical protein